MVLLNLMNYSNLLVESRAMRKVYVLYQRMPTVG